MRVSVAAAEDFDGFYTANFGDTVAMAYTLTADLGEAQDIAQEAFSRAWRRWTDICGYDNPVAWVRHVAANLARSRWRRAKLAASTLVGMRLEEVPPLNPDHVAVVAALHKLPTKQREAVVLHHILDLPVSEVAEHFEVPVGTVKSWLHRGRAALAEDLRIDVSAAIVTPPAGTVKKRGRAAVVVVAGAIVLAVGAATVVLFGYGNGTTPLPPAQSPTPSPADPILSVDWNRAEIEFDRVAEGCPKGKLRFSGAASGGVMAEGIEKSMLSVKLSKMAFGDLNGDGRAEAVLGMICLPTAESPFQDQLVVIERRSDGTLVATGMSTAKRGVTESIWISSGVIHSYSRLRPNDRHEIGELRAWRFNGHALDDITGVSGYPDARSLNLSAISAQLPCGAAKPEPNLRLRFDKELLARAGDQEFGLLRPGEKPIFTSGRLVLTIGCRAVKTTGWHSSVVVFEMIGNEWTAVRIEPS